MLDYLPAVRSDLSRFHGLRGPLEEMDGQEFFNMGGFLGAYDGAVSAMIQSDEKEREAHVPRSPVAKRESHSTNTVSAHQAAAMVNDGREF